MKKILFQGDSITDAGRDRSNDHLNKGYGYATVVSAILGSKYPGEYEFENKGVSGNRIVDVYARIKCDILNIKPDYMSLLIGVNDVWHGIDWANGINNEKFDKIYRMLLDEIYEELPNIKIMILSPFVGKGRATSGAEDENVQRFETFVKGVYEKTEIARQIAKDYSLPFIDLNEIFNNAFKIQNERYWLDDGVHPLASGHGLIANEWIKVFEKIK